MSNLIRFPVVQTKTGVLSRSTIWGLNERIVSPNGVSPATLCYDFVHTANILFLITEEFATSLPRFTPHFSRNDRFARILAA